MSAPSSGFGDNRDRVLAAMDAEWRETTRHAFLISSPSSLVETLRATGETEWLAHLLKAIGKAKALPEEN